MSILNEEYNYLNKKMKDKIIKLNTLGFRRMNLVVVGYTGAGKTSFVKKKNISIYHLLFIQSLKG